MLDNQPSMGLQVTVVCRSCLTVHHRHTSDVWQIALSGHSGACFRMLSTGLLHAVLREMADTYRKLLEAKLGIGDCGLWLAESQVMINLYRMGSCPSDCPTV